MKFDENRSMDQEILSGHESATDGLADGQIKAIPIAHHRIKK